MAMATKEYTDACKDLKVAIDKRNIKNARAAIEKASVKIDQYRVLAKIDQDDGGVINPGEFSSKSGSKVTGTGYVVPVFRGGATGTGIDESFYTLKKQSKV